MRNFSYISKTLSDSIIRIALLTVPLSLPAPAMDPTNDTAGFERPTKETALGRFLQSEIASRIERVSGKSLLKNVRSERAREIAMAVAEASYVHNVDPFLLLSMIEVESRYNVTALGRHGEKGLMQIKPSTARWIASVTDELYECDLHKIRCNIMMGASYVGHLQQKVEKRRGSNEPTGLELSTPVLFRDHVLRSYNLGPAKANRLAYDRTPAAELKDKSGFHQADVVPYATKIGLKADRMRSRYLALAMTH